jgi:hypothetical protein
MRTIGQLKFNSPEIKRGIRDRKNKYKGMMGRDDKKITAHCQGQRQVTGYEKLWNELKEYLLQEIINLQSDFEPNEKLNGKIEGMKWSLIKMSELEQKKLDD